MNSEEIKEFIGALQNKDHVFVKYTKGPNGIIIELSEWFTFEEAISSPYWGKESNYFLMNRQSAIGGGYIKRDTKYES